MTLSLDQRAKHFSGHCPMRRKNRFDDALISLFLPIHETFRVFSDAKAKNVKMKKMFTGFPQFLAKTK
jgi:hypothetical protein